MMPASESIKSNIPEFSVSELAFSLKKTLEEQYARVRVRGELGRVTRAKSGHMYFDLKDDRAVLHRMPADGAARHSSAPCIGASTTGACAMPLSWMRRSWAMRPLCVRRPLACARTRRYCMTSE